MTAPANAAPLSVQGGGGALPSVLVGVTFADVPPTSQFYTEIKWTVSQRISTGWVQADGTRLYQPLSNVNRDAMAAFMYRLEGSPDYTPPAVSPFTDVTPSTQFYKEITWLASKGITTGYAQPDGTRTYQPLSPVNRDGMAAFMYRLAGSPSYFAPVVSPFSDITRMTQFYKEITWLAAQGISTGYPQSDGSKVYSPLNAVARDAMAAFMYRYSHLPSPTPLAVTTTELPQATVGVPYQGTLTASGGSAPYTWSQSGLPSGLSLDSATGQITGTPSSAATAPVTFTVTDQQGHQQMFSTSLSVVRAEFSNVASLATAGQLTYALKKDGTVWSWGRSATASFPTQMPGISGVSSISTSFEGSTYALKSDGTLWAWGNNDYGQLGIGSTAIPSSPTQVQGLTDVKSFTENDGSAYAVKTDGTAWAWGWNIYGALGIGTTANATTPVQIAGLAGVQEIVASNALDVNTTYALLSDGSVWAWGYGVKGATTAPFSTVPVKVAGLGTVKSIAAANGTAYALQTDGTVWAWGGNDQGRLGDGTTTSASTPVQVTGLAGVNSITATSYSAYAIKNDGSLWAWGSSGSGQLGNGTYTGSNVPVQVAGLTGVTGVAVSDAAAYAVTANGTWGWGDGVLTPKQVPGLTSVDNVAVGARVAYAVQSDGTAWAWGDNTYGAFGDGTTTSSSTPVRVGG